MKIKKYLLYGLLGICLEIFWTGFESLLHSDYTMEGTTYIWMFFIYGLAVFLEPVHDKIREYNTIVRGLIYMFLIYSGEFITGFALQKLIGKCPWYYADNGSIYGIITLYFIPVWFSLGLIFERVHDFFNAQDWVNEETFNRHIE